jgi:thiosulfate/3-mercaptopyruvate sulfurtransferase
MSSPFVSSAELRAMLAGADAPTVLDVRWSLLGPSGEQTYAAGHIPGAVHVDLDRDLAGAPGAGGRHPLPDADDFARAMRRAGVSHEQAVVVLDAGDGTVAARAWWLLRHHGHDDVRVLDGGYSGWTASAGPVQTGPAVAPFSDEGPPSRRRFVAGEGRLAVLDAESAAELARDGALLDARAPARYAGDIEPIDPVAGHIPGALSAPTSMSVGSDHLLRRREVLEQGFGQLGALGGARVGAYCGSGVTAAHTVLVLHHLGVQAALFAGSWSQWIADPSRPVATGYAPG